MSIATISRLLKIKVEKEDSFQVDFKEYNNNNNHFSTNIDDETKNIDKSSISFVNQNPKQQTNVNSIPPASKMKKEDAKDKKTTQKIMHVSEIVKNVAARSDNHYLQRLYKILNTSWASSRTKNLITEYIIYKSRGILPSVFVEKFQGDFAMGYEEQQIVYTLELLVRLETGLVLNMNKLNFLTWLDSTSARMRVLAMIGLLAIVEQIPEKAYALDGFIDSIESKFYTILTNVPLVSCEQNNKTSFSGLLGRLGYGLLKSIEPSLLEPSGYPARDFFTILNTLPSSEGHIYHDKHLVHVTLFSMIYAWFLALYHPSHDNNTSYSFLPLDMNLEMEEVIVRYCTRLLDQVAMPKVSSYIEGSGLNDPRLQDDLHEAVTLEALRMLDLLCQRNASIVTRLFPIVKRFAIDKFNAHIRRTNSRHSPIIFLTAIQFFVNHNEVTTMFDVDPIFRSFFHDYLRLYYRNSMLAFETIRFCIFNKRKLLTHTNILFLYFPALLKLVAWHPRSFRNEFVELLPALISPPSCMELLHSILDLPLLASIMESSLENPQALTRKQSVNFDTTGPQKQFANFNENNRNKAKIRKQGREKNKIQNEVYVSTNTGNEGGIDVSSVNAGNSFQHRNIRENEYGKLDADENHIQNDHGKAVKDGSILGRDENKRNELSYLNQVTNYMLRDESSSYGSSGPQKLQRQTAFNSLSGMDGCIWGLDAMKVTVEKLCRQKNVTLRVHEVCLLVPALLNTYFDVMLVDAPEECVCAMVRVIFCRFGMLYGPLQFQGRVRRLLLDRLLASFQKFSHFLMPMKHNIFHVLSDVDPSSNCSELALHACWIVGEYANVNKAHPAMINDLFEALETIIYERLFILGGSSNNTNWIEKNDIDKHNPIPVGIENMENDDAFITEAGMDDDSATVGSIQNENNNEKLNIGLLHKSKYLYPTRLMHVLVSTLTKLGAWTSDLAPRAQLCLAKVISTRKGFHNSVRTRAKESIRLLKLSSVASKIFDLNSINETAYTSNGMVDSSGLRSSLSFLLQPSTTFNAGIKLHDFNL